MSDNIVLGQFDIKAARELALPHHILTDEIVAMYDNQIKAAIRNGRSGVVLKFQQARSGISHSMCGFPSGMSPRRGLEFLREHYKAKGFTVSNVKSHTSDQRDVRETSYTYIEVGGWVP